MKRILLILIILTIIQQSLSSQWYYRHHSVNDPMRLSEEQFDYSTGRATRFIILGSGITLTGGSIAIAGLSSRQYTDPSSVGMGIMASVESAFVIIVALPAIVIGSIIVISNWTDINKIKKTRERVLTGNYSYNISPTLIRAQTEAFCPGIALTIVF